jgi:hypothetical protein
MREPARGRPGTAGAGEERARNDESRAHLLIAAAEMDAPRVIRETTDVEPERGRSCRSCPFLEPCRSKRAGPPLAG